MSLLQLDIARIAHASLLLQQRLTLNYILTNTKTLNSNTSYS